MGVVPECQHRETTPNGAASRHSSKNVRLIQKIGRQWNMRWGFVAMVRASGNRLGKIPATHNVQGIHRGEI